jgi:putative drug exporter of the RND superfamily
MLRAFARAASGPRAKWVVVAAWIALAVVFGALGQRLPDRVDDQAATPSSLPGDTQSARVAETLRERFPGGERFLTLIVYRRAGGLTGADRERIARDAREAAEVEGTAPPAPPFGPGARPELVSRDGAVAFTAVPLLHPRAEDRTEALDELRELTGQGRGGLDVRITGAAALQSDLSTSLEAADAALIAATALIVLLLLVAIYRSPIVPLIPLLVVGLSLVVSQGVIYLYAEATDATIDRTALSLLAVLVFGAGTDYCLLLVARYTAALRRVPDKHDAMVAAFPGAAPAIAASGITVAGALLMAIFARLETNEILGPVNAIGIAVVLLASLTLLPALLAIGGRRAFWPSRGGVELDDDALPRSAPQLLPGLGPLPEGLRRSAEAAGVVRRREGFWGRVGERVVRRPVLGVVVTLALLAGCALGLTGYAEDVDQTVQFREDTDSTDGYDLLRSGFPEGALVPMTVLVDAGDDEDLAPAVAELREEIGELDGVAAVGEVDRRSDDGRAATFLVTFADDPFADPALERVERIRAELADAPPGVTALAGDGTATRVDYRDAARDDQRRIVPLVLLVILVTLIVLLRALVAPLYLLATVVVSFFAALGISVVCFDVLFGQGSVDPVYPLFSFIFLVALGVDYNIFLMSAVREDAAEHGTREAILRAIRNTGPVITSAGIILAGTFAVLTTLPLQILFQIGFTVAVGVLIDTFVVRTVTVPAIAWLLGDSSWWPSRPSSGGRAPAVSGVFRAGPLAAARAGDPLVAPEARE